MKNKILSLIKTTFIRMFYKKNIDYETWVFSSTENVKFNYNSKSLFEFVLINKDRIKPLYVINDDKVREELSKQYGSGYFVSTNNSEGIKKVLNAGVWFTSAGLPIYGFRLNKERIIVNLWHGVPLKKIALMENNTTLLENLYFKFIFSKNYTYVLTTSNNLVSIMSESFSVNKKIVKVWGQPRNDSLFKHNSSRDILSNIFTILPDFKKIILYAPTYRDAEETVLFPFEDFDVDNFNDFLEANEIIVFVRSHQFEENISNSHFGNRVIPLNEDRIIEIMDIIYIFDLLITDYSSIYIDYLLLNKPLLFLPYDKEEYLKSRGMNFKYDDVTPGPKPGDYETFKEDLLVLLNDATYYQREREEVNDYFNEIKSPVSESIVSKIEEEISKRRLK